MFGRNKTVRSLSLLLVLVGSCYDLCAYAKEHPLQGEINQEIAFSVALNNNPTPYENEFARSNEQQSTKEETTHIDFIVSSLLSLFHNAQELNLFVHLHDQSFLAPSKILFLKNRQLLI